jgi:flagellar basal-body rod protein FlgG
MNNSFYIGATGLRAQQTALDIVSNNLANLNTNAFKRSSIVFAELVTPAADPTLNADPAPKASTAAGLGVSVTDLPKVLTPGDYKLTNGALDVAVRGSGFVELLGSSGDTLLWRGGTITVNKDGLLTAPQGAPLKGVSAVPRGTQLITIDELGKVFATTGASTTPRQVGQLELVSPQTTSALEALGDGVYRLSEKQTELVRARPGDQGLGTMAQGYIEGSNVNITEEMVSLMWIQRSYGANARVIQAADELMGMTNSLKR